METEEFEPQEYESPQVVDFGDLTQLTAAGTGGDCLDFDFAAGTRRSSLTFSSC
jgi:hypothetical protein